MSCGLASTFRTEPTEGGEIRRTWTSPPAPLPSAASDRGRFSVNEGELMKKVVGLLAVLVILAPLSLAVPQGSAPQYSVWLVRSSVFKDVPAGAFMPDRAFVPGST